MQFQRAAGRTRKARPRRPCVEFQDCTSCVYQSPPEAQCLWYSNGCKKARPDLLYKREALLKQTQKRCASVPTKARPQKKKAATTVARPPQQQQRSAVSTARVSPLRYLNRDCEELFPQGEDELFSLCEESQSARRDAGESLNDTARWAEDWVQEQPRGRWTPADLYRASITRARSLQQRRQAQQDLYRAAPASSLRQPEQAQEEPFFEEEEEEHEELTRVPLPEREPAKEGEELLAERFVLSVAPSSAAAELKEEKQVEEEAAAWSSEEDEKEAVLRSRAPPRRQDLLSRLYTTDDFANFVPVGDDLVEATDRRTGLPVRIQIVRPRGDDVDRALDTEVTALTQLQSQCVVQALPCLVTTFKDREGNLYIVTDLPPVENWLTLAAWLEGLEEVKGGYENARQVVCNLIQALEAVHTSGVRLRNISPLTVLVDPETLDVRFGADAFSDACSSATTCATWPARSATAAAANEQQYAPPALRPRAGFAAESAAAAGDLWSLGATLWWILVRVPLWTSVGRVAIEDDPELKAAGVRANEVGLGLKRGLSDRDDVDTLELLTGLIQRAWFEQARLAGAGAPGVLSQLRQDLWEQVMQPLLQLLPENRRLPSDEYCP